MRKESAMKPAVKKSLSFCLALALALSAFSLSAAEGTRRLVLYWTDPGAN